jgi:Peptidase family M28
LPFFYGLIPIALCLLCGYITQYLLNEHLPKALTNADLPLHPTEFIAERAWRDLKILNDFGPKPVGTYANEVLAIDFLKREISYIKQLANKKQKITDDHQVVSGAYLAGFRPHAMTNVYRNVQNVIVRLHGSDEGNHTLMLNCHFDSVAGSPGASDDAASCCVMLEILRVLSRRPTKMKHTVLFLFNGAEETPLQASHGFITQHAWASDIRAFLNLESVGSGGKEILFQSGPKHPWLIRHYARAVRHPNGQAAAEEIFHSGVIPSDTDFRIFRDFGHVPGMDFAHVVNGYRYHTRYDHIDYIPYEVLQRTGENMLSLVVDLVESDDLAHVSEVIEEHMVFFDFLGLFFVAYSADFGGVLNVAMVLFTVIFAFLSLVKATHGVNSNRKIRDEAFIGFLAAIVSLLVSSGICYLIALQLDVLGHSMSWYSSTYLAIGNYCASGLLAQCLVHLLADRYLSNRRIPLSLALKVQARLNGTNIFWGFATIGATVAGYRIGYVTMLIVGFSMVSNVVIATLGIQNSVNKWLFVHLTLQVLTILWATHFYHLVTGMFIPIAGRSGAERNPDIIIGIICNAMTFFAASYLTPLVLLLRKPSKFLCLMAVVPFVAISLAVCTHTGFPYRDATASPPKVQRHFITHTQRTFFDYQGGIRHTDGGYWLRELDRNSHKTIDGITMPSHAVSQFENVMCASEVFCGIPFYSSRQVHVGGYWMPGPEPLIREAAKLTRLAKEKLNSHEQRLTFELSGSYLISLMIRPKKTVELKRWSLTDVLPDPNYWNKQFAYFVMVTHGLDAKAPLNITLTLGTDMADFDGPLVDVTVVTTHWEYQREFTPIFTTLLARVPSWAFVVPSVASLKAYTF